MNRKELRREYKETTHPMGVFRVHNTASDRSLIGISTNLPAILNRHRAQLEMRGHPISALQNDWNELGPEAFAFEVLDTIEPPSEPSYDPIDDLKALEQLWLEKLDPSGELRYNRR